MDNNSLSKLPHYSRAPYGDLLWSRFISIIGLVLMFFLFDKLTLLFGDKWLLESLGYATVFWTNFKAGSVLFLIGFTFFSLAILKPFWYYRLKGDSTVVPYKLALIVGLVAGYIYCLHYHDFLLWLNGQSFSQQDPVFNKDLGFYIFTLPAIWLIWSLVLLSFLTAFVASLYSSKNKKLVDKLSTLPSLYCIFLLSCIISIGFILGRYNILLIENKDSAIFTGASYVDFVGLFSTVNSYWLSALIVFITGILLSFNLWQHSKGSALQWKKVLKIILLALAVDFSFTALILVRTTLFVTPNEPIIQMTNIENHINATRFAYGLDKVETISFTPNTEDSPVPDIDELLKHPVIKNAPLWPGFVSYLERLLDPQHDKRIFQTDGSTMVYGPTLEAFQQQEKLRTYYGFINVDAVRYNINGEAKLLTSATREIPLLEPQPWLAWWGQRFVLFTHGSGLVAASGTEKSINGDPVYLSSGIPTTSLHPSLKTANDRIYYGEGSATMAYSNIKGMTEFDFPTDEGRSILSLPDDIKSGVNLDNLWKRIVFGWRSGQFFEIVFSDLIDAKTRVHYFRTPLERIERLVPFLYLDTNPYAVVGEENIYWMINAISTTDQYPYSQYQYLGDKSDQRTRFSREFMRTNYVRDAVKATVNAYSGEVNFYKIADEPIINTWAKTYPDLFLSRADMPKNVAEHMQYPSQLFHIQFDDVYIYYHMSDPMTFFNMEDMWDDADEVRGPIIDQGKAITFSIEPYQWIAATDNMPLPSSGSKTQFVMSMMFTPQSALNLRAIPMVYQDGESYGRMISVQIPKGVYYLGPEQADAAIDQEPSISEQISWWNRRGTDVIRGHTVGMLIDNEIIYVEPIFIRSQQNPVTQLKKVVVVFRGKPQMGDTLTEALRLAIAKYKVKK